MESLREKGFGDWEGMTFAEVEKHHPSMFRRLFDEDIEFAPPGGESDQQLYDRLQSAKEELVAAHQDSEGNILVVAHGGSLRALIACMMDMPPDYMWRLASVELQPHGDKLVRRRRCSGVAERHQSPWRYS